MRPIIRTLILITPFLSGCSGDDDFVYEPPEKTPEQIEASNQAGERFVKSKPLPPQEKEVKKGEFAFTPPEIENWTRSPEPRPIPDSEVGISMAFNFGSDPEGADKITATLYQYDRGLPEISNDLNAAEVKLEMQDALKQISGVAKLGLYSDIKVVTQGFLQLGDSGRQTRYCHLKMKAADNDIETWIYLWTQNNRFLKLRVTHQPNSTDAHASNLRNFFTEIGRASTQRQHD